MTWSRARATGITSHQTSRCTEQPRSRNGPNRSPCPTPPRERRHHHLGPPRTESRRCEPFRQPWSCPTMHGETDGLNPLQPAIGEPPPSAPATENRISCLILIRLVSGCLRTSVEPRNITLFPSSNCPPQVDNLTRSKVQSRHPSRIVQHAAPREGEKCVLHEGLCDHQKCNRTVRLTIWAHRLARQSLSLLRGRFQVILATGHPTNLPPQHRRRRHQNTAEQQAPRDEAIRGWRPYCL